MERTSDEKRGRSLALEHRFAPPAMETNLSATAANDCDEAITGMKRIIAQIIAVTASY
jgi:hypothetical protein